MSAKRSPASRIGLSVKSIVSLTIDRSATRIHCKLYRKFNCNRITAPRNSEGSGGNGLEALIPATAARSRASAPEGAAITSLGTSFLADRKLNYNLSSPP